MGLKVGVIGTGKLGREHVRVLKRVPEVEHVACYDIVHERSHGVASTFGAEAFTDVDAMLDAVDAVSVVVPTVEHATVSLRALDRGKNLFVEKPIAASVGDAQKIIAAARSAGRVLQIGHVERFNAAIVQALPYIESPSFVEIHRLAPFTIRGIDVSVVMDLMIHDLDLLFMFIGKTPVEIRAKGAGILTDGPDIVNARLEYESGCVANLTASRVSVEPMRKVRVFSPVSYLSIDLFRGKVKHFQKGKRFDEGVRKLKEDPVHLSNVTLEDFLSMRETDIKGEEPLFNELQSFCRTIANGAKPAVTGEDGLKALEVAAEIQRIVESDGSLDRPTHGALS